MLDGKVKRVVDYNRDILDSIKSISEPLRIMGIDSFTYLRFYKDGGVLRIGDNIEYSKYMLEYCAVNTYQDIMNNVIGAGEVVVMPFSPSEVVEGVLKTCNISAILASFYPKDDYVEGWGVFSNRDNIDMTTFFVSHVDLIRRFITYFNIVAKDQIEQACKNRVLFQSSLDMQPKPLELHQGQYDEFINATQPPSWQIKNVYGDIVNLTRTEVICLSYLAQGYCYKKMAIVTGCCVKTILKHMENIRNKTGFHNKQKLIDEFTQTDSYLLSPIKKL